MQRTVVITGAERGLGLCLVQAFLADGAVVVAGKRAGDRNLRALGERGGKLTIVQMDVADPGSVRAAGDWVASRFGAVDVLVNSAAVFPAVKGVALEARDLGDGHLERAMQVNAFGPLRVTQRFLPLLEQGAGRTIVQISSEAGSIAGAWRTDELEYCMSKAALNMETRLLANALGPRGYRVVAVHPGWMRTDMGGPAADIPPEESARGVFRIATDPASAGNGDFVDYRGERMEW
jgi:NAD(P)-dependent dehydrogenase (short-subunit alcohol dehydrogenase family)